MAIIQRQSALAFRHVKLASEKPGRLAPYERLSTSHAGLDPLEHIKRELGEVDDTIADLKDEATQSGEAQKYAKTMLNRPPHRSAGHEEEMATGGVITRAFGGLTSRAPLPKSSRPRREALGTLAMRRMCSRAARAV